MLRSAGGTSRGRPGGPGDPVTPAAPAPSRSPWIAWVAGQLVTALLLAAIALAGFIAYGLLDNRWYHVVAVTGGSMNPTIDAGDLIVITRPPARIEAGMILTLEVDGAVVTHRVVDVRPDGSFVTKGDANTARDDFTANTVRVVGEYRLRIPLLGSVLSVGRSIVSGAFFVAGGIVGVAGDIAAQDQLPATAPVTEPARPADTEAVDRVLGPTEPGVSTGPPVMPSPDPVESAPPTAAPAIEPSESAQASPAADPTPTPEPTMSLEPEVAPSPPPSSEPSPTPAPTATPEPGPTVEPSAPAEPDPTPGPSATADPTP